VRQSTDERAGETPSATAAASLLRAQRHARLKRRTEARTPAENPIPVLTTRSAIWRKEEGQRTREGLPSAADHVREAGRLRETTHASIELRGGEGAGTRRVSSGRVGSSSVGRARRRARRSRENGDGASDGQAAPSWRQCPRRGWGRRERRESTWRARLKGDEKEGRGGGDGWEEGERQSG
jgi:hypothetical protein